MVIKKRTVGSGRPLLCVPVTETRTSRIVETINSLAARRMEAIEWRADYYDHSSDPKMITAILQEVRHKLRDTILIVTYRTRAEGGEGDADTGLYEEILMAAADTGVPDFIDLEFAMSQKLPMLMHSLQACGVRVIASYHNFERTPSAQQLKRKYRDMFAAGADIAKVAVMPQDFSDVCCLTEVSYEMSAAAPSDRALIAISMGQLGALTRLAGEICGSCLTFVTDGPASAPGQMSYGSVAKATDAIHACLTGGR